MGCSAFCSLGAWVLRDFLRGAGRFEDWGSLGSQTQSFELDFFQGLERNRLIIILSSLVSSVCFKYSFNLAGALLAHKSQSETEHRACLAMDDALTRSRPVKAGPSAQKPVTGL